MIVHEDDRGRGRIGSRVRSGGQGRTGGAVHPGEEDQRMRSYDVVGGWDGYENRRGERHSLGYTGTVRVHGGRDGRGRSHLIDIVGQKQPVVSYDLYKKLLNENEELKKRIEEIEEADAEMRKKRKWGRSNIKKWGWTMVDNKNELLVTDYCRREIYPYYKYLPRGWAVFSDDKTTLCGRMHGKLVVPKGLKWRYYWDNRAVEIINKKFIDFRNNDRTSVHRQFRSKCMGVLTNVLHDG